MTAIVTVTISAKATPTPQIRMKVLLLNLQLNIFSKKLCKAVPVTGTVAANKNVTNRTFHCLSDFWITTVKNILT